MNTLLTTYLLVSTIIIGFLYFIWNRSSTLNVTIKFTLFLLLILGVLVNYQHFTH